MIARSIRSLLAAALLCGIAASPAFSQIRERTREELIDLGRGHAAAWALYQTLLAEAGGGRPLASSTLPDWSGIYTRGEGGLNFDPTQPPGGLAPARLTPEYEARYRERLQQIEEGEEFDPISTCAPPGHPRWLTEPFLREFVVTPDQTYLINEMVNDVRRIYTDGRDHVPEADRYPLYNGDSIGFWDGQKLVIHTNQLDSGRYQRQQPDYSDQVETVEIWEKVDEDTLGVDVWVYDPPSLIEPWYTRQTYAKLTNDDKSLRIRYWYCGENPNNTVIQTEGGGTDFLDFTFTQEDDRP